MDFISDFLEANEVQHMKEPDSTASTKSAVVPSKPIQESGKLLITACNDWEHCTDKNAGGLDEYHLINLEANVKEAFTSATSRHTFFLLANDTVYGLGLNDEGQIGTGDTQTVHYPVKIKLPITSSKVKKIATGRAHSIILFENGEIYGCGSKKCGQLYFGPGKRDLTTFSRIPTAHSVVDVTCGHEFSVYCDVKGHVYSFGHPEYGQLGLGSTGEFIKTTGVTFNFVTAPTQIVKFVTKDHHNKVTQEIHAENVKIVQVSAGRNHTMLLEAFEIDPLDLSEDPIVPLGRVYSFGMGGYGRLGHSGANDELFPREISFFSAFRPANQGGGQINQPLKQKQVRSIHAGNTASYALSETKHLYYWGQSAGSKEAPTYPRMQQELYDYPARSLAVGAFATFVASDNITIGWGKPVTGKFGFSDNAGMSVNPREITALAGLHVLQMSAGYSHLCAVVRDDTAGSADVASITKPTKSTSKKSSSTSTSEPVPISSDSKLFGFPHLLRESTYEVKANKVKKSELTVNTKKKPIEYDTDSDNDEAGRKKKAKTAAAKKGKK